MINTLIILGLIIYLILIASKDLLKEIKDNKTNATESDDKESSSYSLFSVFMHKRDK